MRCRFFLVFSKHTEKKQLDEIADAEYKSGHPLHDFIELMKTLAPDLMLRVAKRYGVPLVEDSEEEVRSYVSHHVKMVGLVQFYRRYREDPSRIKDVFTATLDKKCPPGCTCRD